MEGYWWFSPPSCCFNLIRWTPLTLGSSAVCCVRAGEEGDVPESRRHRLAVQVELGVFSEVCGHFYVAAGRWSAKRRLAESKDGGAVLKVCISCHIHHHSPVEDTTSSQLGSLSLSLSLSCFFLFCLCCTLLSLFVPSFLPPLFLSLSSFFSLPLLHCPSLFFPFSFFSSPPAPAQSLEHPSEGARSR